MKNTIITASILLGFSFTAVPLHAQTVKTWVDEQGVTHYSDQEPVGGKSQVEEIEVPAAGVNEYGTEETNIRIQNQLQQLEQDRKAREQAAEQKEKARALEEAMEREPMVVEEKKKKKKKGRSNQGGPYPRPLPTYPQIRPGLPSQD
jgi:hypothetical protein